VIGEVQVTRQRIDAMHQRIAAHVRQTPLIEITAADFGPCAGCPLELLAARERKRPCLG